MQKLLFVFLLSIVALGATAQAVSSPQQTDGHDGKPGLPLPAMRFPDETPGLLQRAQDSSMFFRIRELPEIPGGLPGKPVPAMEFPDEKHLHGDDLDSPETRIRAGDLLLQQDSEARSKAPKKTATKK